LRISLRLCVFAIRTVAVADCDDQRLALALDVIWDLRLGVEHDSNDIGTRLAHAEAVYQSRAYDCSLVAKCRPHAGDIDNNAPRVGKHEVLVLRRAVCIDDYPNRTARIIVAGLRSLGFAVTFSGAGWVTVAEFLDATGAE